MTIRHLIPIYSCVMWDGTNLEEIQSAFPRYAFTDVGGPITVSGPGMTGTVEQGWYLYGVPGPAGISLSFTDPIDNILYMEVQIPTP